MIDKCNEIFSTVASDVRKEHPGTTVMGEYTRKPSKFPCLTLDEIENVTVEELVDSSDEENFSGVTYRLQSFSNRTGQKKAEARKIFATADKVMLGLGFRRITYTTTPEIYDSTIYSIQATYRAVIDANGVIYKRK